MRACVFVGPTLRPEEVARVIDAACLPPVTQGDVCRAVQGGARIIGIVDGLFSGAPSVWHKEILWALSQGVPVFGSASMGALRAAELHGFGMQGVGRVFQAFRDGVLEDDDEVAVVHGPAETGYLVASEAMVNIRATLARAEAEGVLRGAARAALEAYAKALFFPRRTWAALIAGAAGAGVPDSEVAALRAWLPRGRVDQKREDAVAMLEAMRRAAAAGAAVAPSFRFEWTHFWGALAARCAVGGREEDGAAREVLDELRLAGPERFAVVRTRALARLLAEAEARRRGLRPSAAALRSALDRLRRAHGLYTRAATAAWAARNDLDAADLDRLVESDALAAAVLDAADPGLDRHLIDELRLSGAYEGLAARARRKRAALAGAGPRAATPVEDRLWFFERRLGRPMPDDVEGFARALGFASLADFDGSIGRERLYLQTRQEPDGDARLP